MKLYKFEETITIKSSLDDAWGFFSNPKNLSLITPKKLNFKILSPLPEEIYHGLIIHYHVSPLFGVPLNWVTEITHLIDRKLFVDEQRFGPYQFWHHQHHFEKTGDGVKMRDIVHYSLALDPLSRPVHSLVVRPQVEGIFRFRAEALKSIFRA